MSTIQTATDYIQRGWSVFPLLPKSKAPACAGGFLSAIQNEDAIKTLWKGNDTFNIGIATGERSGFFVLDIDGPEGEETINAFQSQYSNLPITLTSITGKGRHLLFKMPDVPLRNSVRKLGKGLDIRANGGYIVAPPSIHPSGAAYRWEIDAADIQDAPDWLISLIEQPVTQNQPTLTYENEWSREDVLDMLSYIHPDDDYASWITIGMSLHSAGYGLEVWDNWSRKGAKYQINECRKHWKTFHADGSVTLGTLVHQAQKSGWSSHASPVSTPVFAKAYIDSLTAPKNAPKLGIDPEYIPGIVGDTVRWIVSTATKPQPTLAMMNVLCVLGSMFGRNYESYTGLMTNIYMVSVGSTGCGKDASRQATKKIMMCSGDMKTLMGGDQIRSAAGVISMLSRSPKKVILHDEFGMFLAALGNKNVASHLAGVSSLLTQLYSSSSSMWDGGEYASDKNNIKPIAQPSLSIYGTTTLDVYASALKTEAIKSGELNRYIILPADEDVTYVDEPMVGKPPQAICDAWTKLYGASQKSKNNLGASDPYILVDPVRVGITEVAKKMMVDIRQIQETNIKTDLGALWNRYVANTQKIAMILAIARSPEQPAINDEDVTIADRIVNHSIQYAVKIATEHMYSGEFEKRLKYVKRLLDQGGRDGCPRSYLTAKCQSLNMKSKEVEEVLDTLHKSGECYEKQKASQLPDGSRSPQIYASTKYMNA